jgi:hypothetical protein
MWITGKSSNLKSFYPNISSREKFREDSLSDS